MGFQGIMGLFKLGREQYGLAQEPVDLAEKFEQIEQVVTGTSEPWKPKCSHVEVFVNSQST